MTPGGHLPGLLGPLATAARALWFLSWSVLAGATAWSWLFGPTGGGGPPGGERALLLGSLWRRALRLGWLWVAQATMLRFLIALFSAASGSAPSAVTGETGFGWLVLVVALGLVRPPIRRMASGPTSTGGSVFELDRWSVSWLVGTLALGTVVTLPTSSKVTEVLRVAIATTHLASAGVWLGTLALFVVLMRTRSWRAASPAGTSLRPVVRPVAEMAARAAAVLVVSGIAAATISAPGLGRWTTEYSGLLVAKAVVLVVAAAIAWRQWVIVHSPGSVTRATRATSIEAGALLTAAALAAVLMGVDPLPAASATAAKAPTASAPAAPACLTASPATDCDATAIAAAVANTPGSGIDALLPKLCTADPTRPKAYAYFSCLETAGQAVAGQSLGFPVAALAHCQAFADPWAQQSCAGGVFSKLISEEVSSTPSADPHADQPVWPCPSVADTFKQPCYLLATTRVLWLNGGDVKAAFHTCDQLDAAWQPTCYQSMGRDLTTRSDYDPAAVETGCAQAGALGPGPCVTGAVRTFVFTRHAEAAATLCRNLPAADRPACDDQRTAAVALS